jgi:hypothetical protein
LECLKCVAEQKLNDQEVNQAYQKSQHLIQLFQQFINSQGDNRVCYVCNIQMFAGALYSLYRRLKGIYEEFNIIKLWQRCIKNVIYICSTDIQYGVGKMQQKKLFISALKTLDGQLTYYMNIKNKPPGAIINQMKQSLYSTIVILNGIINNY